MLRTREALSALSNRRMGVVGKQNISVHVCLYVPVRACVCVYCFCFSFASKLDNRLSTERWKLPSQLTERQADEFSIACVCVRVSVSRCVCLYFVRVNCH